MTFKKLLLSCAVGICFAAPAFMTTGFAPDKAYAQTAQQSNIFSPVSGWAVSKIGDVSGGSGYCALARRFSNNSVVTIAQNASKEASVAFDFQRRLFSVGRSYTVGLGAQDVSLEYDVQATSPSAFVVRLGRDTRLLDAMREGQLLNMMFVGESYQYRMAEMAAGLMQLEACLGQGGLGGNSDIAAAEIEKLQFDLMRLEKEKQELLLSLDEERGSVVSGLSEQRERDSNIKTLMQRLESLERKNNALNTEISKIRSDKEGVETAGFANALAAEAAIRERDEMRSMLNLEKSKRAEVEQLASQQAALSQEKAQLLRRVQELETRNRSLSSQIQNAQVPDGQLTALKRERDNLMRELTMEREKVNRTLAERSSGDSKTQDMIKRLSLLEDSNKRLLAQVERYESAQLMSGNSNVSGADQAGLRYAQSEIDELKTKLAMERDERMRLARVMASSGGAGNSSEALQALNSRLNALQAENQDLRNRLENSDMPVSLSASGDGAVLSRLVSEKAEITKEKIDLNGRIRSLEARNLELERALSEARNAQAQLSTRAQDDRFTRSKDQVRFDIAQSNHQASHIQTELEIALAERDKYRGLLETERLRLKEVESLRNRIGSIGGDQKSLNSTVQQLQNERVELIRALEFERAKLSMIEQEKGQMPSNLINMPQAEMNALRAERNELRRLLEEERHRKIQVAELEQQVSNVARDESRFTQQIDRLNAEKEELASLLRQAQRDAEQARTRSSDFARSTPRVDSAQAEMRMSGNVSDQQRIMLLEQENRRLYMDMKALQARQSELASLQNGTASLRQQNEMLRTDIGQRRDMARAVQQQDPRVVGQLEARIEALSQENAALNNALAQMSSNPMQAMNPAMPNAAFNPNELQMAQQRINQIMTENASLSRELAEALARPTAIPAPVPATGMIPGEVIMLEENMDGELALDLNELELTDRERFRMRVGHKQEVLSRGSAQLQNAENAAALPTPEIFENHTPMQPILDGPGEMELARAVQQGGGVIVQQRQVKVAHADPDMMVDHDIPMDVVVSDMGSEQLSMDNGDSPDGQDIASLLVQSGVPLVNGFEKVNSVSHQSFSAFRWDTGTVYGSAEKSVMADATMFQDFVEGYIRKTQGRCAGTFDRTPYDSFSGNGVQVESYDIACINSADSGAGAALLFYNQGRFFTVIAHEGALDQFDQAMTTRDQIKTVLVK